MSLGSWRNNYEDEKMELLMTLNLMSVTFHYPEFYDNIMDNRKCLKTRPICVRLIGNYFVLLRLV